jgi:hypothetical protein
VLEQSAGREVLRVLVGPWAQMRRDTAARKLESGPAASGVFARPDPGGERIDLLDDRGRVELTVGRGSGLLAATKIEAQQPTWMVTGVDATGVAAAAAALRPGGTLAVWSAYEDRTFEERLRSHGFDVTVEKVRGRLKKGGPKHTIFLARKHSARRSSLIPRD